MTEIKIQNRCWKKTLDKEYVHEKPKNLIIVPKLYWDPEYWRLAKLMRMAKRQRQKYKQLLSIYSLMCGLELVPKSVMQKQANVKWLSKCKNVY